MSDPWLLNLVLGHPRGGEDGGGEGEDGEGDQGQHLTKSLQMG